jgi:phosphopantothenoylcysteine decarboxylase/phosphopantothenate--cysteine ligase
LIVGFAAETENPLENGRAKLLRKGVDAIVVNDVSRDGIGFDSDNNGATFLTATTAQDLPEMSKRKLADRILDEVVALRRPQSLLVELSGMESELENSTLGTEEGINASMDSEFAPSAGRRGQIIIE